MTPKRIINRQPDAAPPWPPLSVSLSALLFPTFPAGTAILTIRNLQRLGQLDQKQARILTIAVLAVFVAGLAAIFAVSRRDTHGIPSFDAGTETVLAVGVAVASFAVQRLPFRAWRERHRRDRTSSWLGAIGMSVVYEVIAIIVGVPLVSLILVIFWGGKVV